MRYESLRYVRAGAVAWSALGAVAWLSFCSYPAMAESIDPCLVGTWEAREVKQIMYTPGAKMPIGGEGIRVTFQANGTQATDYANMKPVEWDSGTRFANGHTFRGSAVGQIKTDGGVATVLRMQRAEVTMQLWDSGGQRKFPPMKLPGLGPGGLGSTAQDNGYVCAGNSLQYKTSVAADKRPSFAIRFARVTGVAPPPDPMVKITGKTWLMATELKDRPQDLAGAWQIDPPAGGDETWHWVDAAVPGRLRAHSLKDRDPERYNIDMRDSGNRHWVGKVYVCPRPKGTCPNLCDWTGGTLDVDVNNVSIKGQWQGKKTKPDCSGYSDVPESGDFTLKRLVGAGFVPIARGKYMNLVGAPAVGDQKAQFKAAVRIVARYDAVPGATVRAVADRGKLTLADKASGTYDFVAEGSGIHEIRFELLGADGKPFHVDRLRVEIPAIGGLGR